MSQTALVLVDFQKGFADPVWGTRNNQGAEEKAAELLAHWRQRGWPVFIVRHDSISPMSPLNPMNGGNELVDFTRPREGETLITKHVNSAFIDTNLETELRAAKVARIVLAGATSDHCVSTTARMAANLGFEVLFSEDATYTFNRTTPEGENIPAEEVHKVHLASLDGEFASVLPTAEIISRVG